MNTGLVSSRYAQALLKFVAATGNGENVYRQVCLMESRLSEMKELRTVIDNPMSVPDRVKYSLLESALEGGKLEPELGRFIRLVMKKRRIRYLHFMLRSFISQYREAHGIKVGKLITARPSPELEDRLISLAYERTGDAVLFEKRVDPDIIGGFIFELDGYRMDASIASQLKAVRRQFIEKNRRIV